MNEHPSLDKPTSGSIRFNTDSRKLEIYNGEAWWEIDATSPELETGGTRGLFYGGNTPSNRDRIEFINVDTTGNSVDFGNLLSALNEGGGGSADRTRGLISGGHPATNVIQFVTIASTGDASDFSDVSVPIQESSGASSPIRGIFVTGSPNSHDHLEALEFATLGNERRFGDLTQPRNHNCSASNCHGGLG